jgi:hypothetical protein
MKSNQRPLFHLKVRPLFQLCDVYRDAIKSLKKPVRFGAESSRSFRNLAMPHIIAQLQSMEVWLLAHWWDIVRIVGSRYIDRYIPWAIRPRQESVAMNHEKISLQFCGHLQLYLHISMPPWLQKKVRLVERSRLQICRIFDCYEFVLSFAILRPNC